MSGLYVAVTDTKANGPQLNAVRVITEAADGGPLPADLPVDQDTWGGLVEWLDGSLPIIDSEPCLFTQDAANGMCIFATPGSPHGESVILDITAEGQPDGWVVYDWEAIVHAT